MANPGLIANEVTSKFGVLEVMSAMYSLLVIRTLLRVLCCIVGECLTVLYDFCTGAETTMLVLGPGGLADFAFLLFLFFL